MTKAEFIFKYIVQYKFTHDGNSPSIREIERACGYRTSSGVYYQLQKLERQGRITLGKNIEVVGGRWDLKQPVGATP